MRIATSALLGMALTLGAAAAVAQPAPPLGPAGPAVPPAPIAPPVAPGEPPAPPAPPPAGQIDGSEIAPPPPIPSPFPSDDRKELAGYRGGGFYLRDSRDIFRLYPQALLQVDLSVFAGAGVSKAPTSGSLGTSLDPRVTLRRARIGLGGEMLRRFSFLASVELGGQPLGNTNGTAESAAAKAGETPSADTARFAAIQSATPSAALADAYVNYSACACFNVMFGQFNAPFSLENRTPEDFTTFRERNLAIRGFAVGPGQRELGAALWGEIGPGVFDYEFGVFGGDSQNRPGLDSKPDFMGRFFTRPFAATGQSDLARTFQAGVSMRHGERDPNKIGYDYSPISTGQGFGLWSPTYTDSLGRLIHVIPSGAQNAIGGELRARTSRVALQAEAYYVVNDTREAVDGFQLTSAERYGRMKGVGWYAQLSAWPFGDAFIAPEPGLTRPRHLDLDSERSDVRAGVRHGLEVMALASGVNANYQGATRLKSTPDPKAPPEAVIAYQLGLGAQYWYSQHLRFTFDYFAYLTPGSGTADNSAAVVDNIVKDKAGVAGTAHVLHELGLRLTATF